MPDALKPTLQKFTDLANNFLKYCQILSTWTNRSSIRRKLLGAISPRHTPTYNMYVWDVICSEKGEVLYQDCAGPPTPHIFWVVDRFTYLGICITNNGCIGGEIHVRLARVVVAFMCAVSVDTHTPSRPVWNITAQRVFWYMTAKPNPSRHGIHLTVGA